MDNNASRINSLNTNRMNSQTAGGQNRARTAASGTNSAGAQNPGNISRTPGGNSDYGVARSATQLKAGDIVKGEISDLRGNQITVTLDNNTILKGYIADSSKLSIGQTAEICGFSNLSHFSRYFKRHCGCSPREWQQQGGKSIKYKVKLQEDEKCYSFSQ